MYRQQQPCGEKRGKPVRDLVQQAWDRAKRTGDGWTERCFMRMERSQERKDDTKRKMEVDGETMIDKDRREWKGM
jgi:hypothetical protein